MSSSIAVRNALIEDVPRLTEIYNDYVRDSHVTFDIDEHTVEQRTEWFGHYLPDGPHQLLVAERDRVVLGYATSSLFRPKPGYRTTVETTVYLHAEATGAGIGGALYAELLARVDAAGVHRAVAGIAVPNPASAALHRRFGFVEIGTFTEVGTKFGRYIDVQWFERRR